MHGMADILERCADCGCIGRRMRILSCCRYPRIYAHYADVLRNSSCGCG